MKRLSYYVLTGLLILSSLTGCNALGFIAPSPTPIPTATVIPTPVPTATPDIGRVSLIAPPEILPEEVNAVLSAIQPAVSAAGMITETLGQVPAGSLGPNRVAAIFLSMPANLVDILTANPQTQVIVVSNDDLQTGPNLTVLRVHKEYQAFIAGFASVLAAPNWRAAGLIPDDGGETNLMANAFMSGGRYFCGRCGTSTPPYAPYPLTESASSTASPAEWQTAVTNILPAGLESLYFSKESQSPELIQSLASQNLFFLGTSYPGDAVKDRWVATISMDISGTLAKVMPDILSGKGGQIIPVGVKLSDINEAYLTIGKQRLIAETNEKLMKGWVNPFTIIN
jgi:hypothetical protein